MNTCPYCGTSLSAYLLHDCPERHRFDELRTIDERWKATVDDIAKKLDRILELLGKQGGAP